jgi:hypothetical protein
MANSLFNPFPGLRPFESHEAHLFFGRDGQSDELLRRLRRTRFLAVVGTSGSGKSSLMRAGLLPALHGGMMAKAGASWRVAIMRPGADPIGNLAQALHATQLFPTDAALSNYQTSILRAGLSRSSLGLIETCKQASLPANENLLVVVDQFEELFRFKNEAQKTGHGDEAAAFVQLLLEAARQQEIPIYVVLTMRSDFLGDCAQFRDLPEAINEGQYLIPRMTREQRRAAITGPVAVAQGKISDRLVNRLLNDVGDNPDQLPILQHALMRTWDYWQAHRQNNEPLDLRHYDDVGGMNAALSQHADEAYNELPDERSRKIAERMFKCLTEKGPDNREIRRPVKLGEIGAVTEATEAEVIAVIERFRQPGRSFLMPPTPENLISDTPIDISHESLIRNWKKLKEWVDEETRSAESYQRLAETAVLHGEGRAGLWRDPDLQIALDWREHQQPNASWAQRYHSGFDAAVSFLQKSASLRRKQRWQRLIAVAAFVLAIVAATVWLMWGKDIYEVANLQAPLRKLQQGRMAVVDFDKQMDKAKESIRDLRQLDKVKQAFLAVLLDSMETAACNELNRPRAESYQQTLLKNLPMPETLRQPRLRKIKEDYDRRVKQTGIGLTPAIHDTVKTWLDLALVAFDRDAQIEALLADLATRKTILDSLQVRIPQDKRFLIGDVPQKNLRLKIILKNTGNVQDATVFMDEAKMPLENFGGQPHRAAFKTFSSDQIFADSTKIIVPLHAVTEDGIEVTRPDTFWVKKLRRRAISDDLNYGDVVRLLVDFDFYDRFWNPKGAGFTKHFAVEKERFLRKGNVIVDRATGLMWQQAGSPDEMTYAGAEKYVHDLNAQRFAGYSDWRLPTLEEAMSLMEPKENSDGLYIDAKFDAKQRWIWTADKESAGRAWYVPFLNG